MIWHHLDLEQELEWTATRHLCELVIEDPRLFREIVRDLTAGEEEKKASVAMEGKSLNFDKDVEVIFNPLKLDFNSKRAIVTLLKLLLKASMSEDFYLATNTLKTKIVKYFNEMVDAGDFGFEVSVDDFTMDSVAKAISVHIVGDEDDPVELLTDYVSMMTELAQVKLFVFVNLRGFLSDEEMKRLHHNLDNHQIDVLLLESTARGRMKDVPRMVVDADGCEI